MNASRGQQYALALSELPPTLQETVRMWFEHLTDRFPQWASSGVDLEQLTRLVACSEFAGSVLLREWDWFCSESAAGRLSLPPDQDEIGAACREMLGGPITPDDIKRQLRRLRNRSMLHVLWRSTGQHYAASNLAESLQSLSDLADALIRVSTGAARQMLESRFGSPVNEQRKEIPLVTLAMGKLGGGELNFSSDIDLIFLYPEEGETSGPRKLSAHEYFTRLARLAVALLEDVTEDGFVYRVDTRLRPFGDSGPPVVSFTALEAYLPQHGRSWERYAYIKARPVTPEENDGDIAELMQNLIEPFVYRRYLDYGVFESLREMKALIAAEVRKRELAGNIKLGPGGIREVEFIVQSLQLVRGGNYAQLKCRQLRTALERLARGNGITPTAALSLNEAYSFLRRFENAIQAIRDQQTHDVPENEQDRARLVVAFGRTDWGALYEELQQHRQTVNQLFEDVAFRTDQDATETDLDAAFTELWNAGADEDTWARFLAKNDFGAAAELARSLVAFAQAASASHIGVTTRRRLRRFVPALLALLHDRRKPQVVAERVFEVVTQILRRSAYIALLNENPATMRHLVMLCEKSAYLAGEIARYPLLLDELLDPRLYTKNVSVDSMREDLAERFSRAGEVDSERQIEILTQFQRATLFRIAVADITGNLPIMKVSDRLTDLAEIVVRRALALAWVDLKEKYGTPQFNGEHGVEDAGLGVIAYGKMAGMELSYHSDLDLVFLHDSQGDGQYTDGVNSLENSVFFVRLVRRLVHFLTTQTTSGALYNVDTRLRPSGHSGLLVVSIEGFERYQDENAWTWEHQALLRSRSVAGSGKVARAFERIRADTLRQRVDRETLLSDVLNMRAKMRKQLDKSSNEQFDIKQGEGGIGDIEFLVQYLVLKNAADNPAVIHYPDNIRQLGALGAAGLLAEQETTQLQDAYRAYRLRLHRLSLNSEPPFVPGSEFVDERNTVRSLWRRHMGQESQR